MSIDISTNTNRSEQILNKKASIALSMVLSVRAFAKSHDLLNTQAYLDFEDKLNELSVEDPNK